MKTTDTPNPKEETMWAVWNEDFGFYVGTAFTREQMKKTHMSDLGYADWRDCAKKGDRCIKVRVIPLENEITHGLRGSENDDTE